MVFSYLFVFVYNYVIIPCFFEKIQENSAHNEIGAFYAHMVLTHERRFARWFCHDSGNIAMRYFLDNKKTAADFSAAKQSFIVIPQSTW